MNAIDLAGVEIDSIQANFTDWLKQGTKMLKSVWDINNQLGKKLTKVKI